MPDAEPPRPDSAAKALAAAASEALGEWAYGLLIDRLERRADPTDFRVESLWPAIIDWYAESAPGTDRKDDWLSLEVAFQSGDDDDAFPIEPPDGLDETAQWFNVDFLRTPCVRLEDGALQTSVGLSAWFAPAPPLRAMLDDPSWDTGNLLGFDCLGYAGPEAREWCAQPAVAGIIDALEGLEPAAVVVFDHFGDEHLHLSARRADPS